jgi:predicted SnoaL-like aldol condensation-catalyzing enzyme
MKHLLSIAVAALSALVVAVSPSAQGTMSPQEQQNLTFVSDWWRTVVQARHTEEAEKYMAPDYIQHNPNISTGRDAFVKVFGGRPRLDVRPEVFPAAVVEFAKGPYVLFMFEREAKDQNGATYKYNFFDLIRTENGKVAEHWDSVFRAAPAAGQPAPAPVIPGIGPRPVKPRNTPEEQRNEDIANIEFKDILQYGHVELAEKLMAPGYIQHNPNVPTGRAAFVAFFGKIMKPEPIRPAWKDEPELILTSGNMVLYMFRRFSADPSNPSQVYKWNWFDMVRVDGGLVREHWDMATKTQPPASVPMPAGFREYR